MAYVIIHGRGLSGLGRAAPLAPVTVKVPATLPRLPVTIKLPPIVPGKMTILQPPPPESKGISGGAIALGLGVLAVVVVASRMGG